MSGRNPRFRWSVKWSIVERCFVSFIERRILHRTHSPRGGAVWDEGEFRTVGICGTCGAAMNVIHAERRVLHVFWETPDGRRTRLAPPCVNRRLKPDRERCNLCERTGDERLKSLCPGCLSYVRGRLEVEP